MNWNRIIRQTHRWVSIIFTLLVIVVMVASAREEPPLWVSLMPLAPLAVLLITGLYLFVLPYLSRRRGQ